MSLLTLCARPCSQATARLLLPSPIGPQAVYPIRSNTFLISVLHAHELEVKWLALTAESTWDNPALLFDSSVSSRIQANHSPGSEASALFAHNWCVTLASKDYQRLVNSDTDILALQTMKLSAIQKD